MLKQSTSCVVMVRPDHFGFNTQTAATNPYQHSPESIHKQAREIQKAAMQEFNNMVLLLRTKGVSVLELPSPSEITPDAIFPNNWFSHHSGGTLVYYPMLVPNRRLERQTDKLETRLKQSDIPMTHMIDLRNDEENGNILESTGSMVFDRINKVAFAMMSPRTTQKEFEKVCNLLHYESVYLPTPRKHRQEVYHTNLLMSIGSEFAIVCSEVLEDAKEQKMLMHKLSSLGKTIIEISLEQVYSYCGNILEVQNSQGEKFITLSKTAYNAFTRNQRKKLEQFAKLLVFSIPTIEEIGGGGVRCMLAEVFIE